jgi:riboflavin kinase/FMN adenylyltransferase
MHYLPNIEAFKPAKNLAIALGNFDGIHLGHQELLKTLSQLAKYNNLSTALVTFSPHPTAYFQQSENYRYILNDTQKQLKATEYALDYYIPLKFDHNLAKLTPQEFLDDILLQKLKAKAIVTGYNFKFGAKRAGSTNDIDKWARQNNIEYRVIDQVMFDGLEVSTTNIKTLLSQGRVITANSMLGRPFSLSGTVIEGRKLASKTFSIPTANIEFDQRQAELLPGVYQVFSKLDGEILRGIANYGYRPTVGNTNKIYLEVHFFGLDANLYGRNIELNFIEFIRPERKFSNLIELKAQILTDLKSAQYSAKNFADHFRRIVT